MVCEYGMSENLGPLSFGKKDEQIFLGREISQHRDYSEETAQKIDGEVRSIVTRAYEKTTNMIRENIETLHQIASALLERETLDGKDLDEILGIEPTPAGGGSEEGPEAGA
jgi:cell division protease FtsH